MQKEILQLDLISLRKDIIWFKCDSEVLTVLMRFNLWKHESIQ